MPSSVLTPNGEVRLHQVAMPLHRKRQLVEPPLLVPGHLVSGLRLPLAFISRSRGGPGLGFVTPSLAGLSFLLGCCRLLLLVFLLLLLGLLLALQDRPKE